MIQDSKVFVMILVMTFTNVTQMLLCTASFSNNDPLQRATANIAHFATTLRIWCTRGHHKPGRGCPGDFVLDAPGFEVITEATVQERTRTPNTPSNILLNCFFQVQVRQQPPMSMNVIQRLLRLPAERVMRCRPLLRHPLRFPSHLRGRHSFRLTGPLVCPGFANRSATARA